MSTKISALPAATTPVGAQFCVIQGGETKRLPTTALGGAAVGTPGAVPLYDGSGWLIANGIAGNDVDGGVTVDLIARGLHGRTASGTPSSRLLFEAAAVADDTVYDIVLPAAKDGTVALTSDIPAFASQAEAEAGTATNRMMSPLRVAQAIAELAGSGVTVATRAQAIGGTDNATMMTPLRALEARRVVERVSLSTVVNGNVFVLGTNCGAAARIIERIAWMPTALLTGGDVPPHQWTLRLARWGFAGFDGDATTDVNVSSVTDIPAQWTGLSFDWPSKTQLLAEYVDLSGSGAYMQIDAAEMEIEWRDAV